jgi:hypothetical protein
LYLARNDNRGGIAGFAATDGQLVALPGSPWSLDASGPDTMQLAFDPSGTRLFASDQGDGRLLSADFDSATGMLTPRPSYQAPSGLPTCSMALMRRVALTTWLVLGMRKRS